MIIDLSGACDSEPCERGKCGSCINNLAGVVHVYCLCALAGFDAYLQASTCLVWKKVFKNYFLGS